MDKASFPGHQSDERILYQFKPHMGMKYFAFAQILVIGLFLLFGIQVVLGVLLPIGAIQILSLIFCIAILGATIWWIQFLHEGTDYFVTDRRVVKFVPTTPFHRSTRSLFWDQSMKTKTYFHNPIVEKLLGIGSIEVHSRHHEADNLDIHHVVYHKDLGNYIDKLIFLNHNKPEEIPAVREFVPKPIGERY